jgi:hypothetical protein
MKLLLLCCAQSCTVDKTTNNVSIFNIIEEVQAPSFPGAIVPFSVFALITRTKREASTQTAYLQVFKDNQIKPILEAPMNLDFQQQFRTRAIGNLGGLVVESPGMLRFVIREKRSELGSWAVPVLQAGAVAMTGYA